MLLHSDSKSTEITKYKWQSLTLVSSDLKRRSICDFTRWELHVDLTRLANSVYLVFNNLELKLWSSYLYLCFSPVIITCFFHTVQHVFSVQGFDYILKPFVYILWNIISKSSQVYIAFVLQDVTKYENITHQY